MSNCYACNTKGRHVAVILPRDGSHEVGIVHECINPDCPILRWEEAAEESVAQIAKSWGRDANARNAPSKAPAPPVATPGA